MRGERSRNGTYFRADAVVRFLANQPDGHHFSAYGVAWSIQIVDPGCTKHQAKYALEMAVADGYVQRGTTKAGPRAICYHATPKGRRYAR